MANPTLLRAPTDDDARLLFPYVFGTSVTDSISWDGPTSFEEFQREWDRKVRQVQDGIGHFFVIVASDGHPAGACSLTPNETVTVGEIGFWIAEPYQRRGLATQAVAQLVSYSFDVVGVRELMAEVFVGNTPSRKVLERSEFVLSETIPRNSLKRGELRDDWRFRLTNPGMRQVARTTRDTVEG